MTTIKLVKFGEVLGTRVLGNFVRKKFHIGERELVLDFSGVRCVTNSFADEAVGKPSSMCDIHKFFELTKIVGASEPIKLVLKMAIVNRQLESMLRGKQGHEKI